MGTTSGSIVGVKLSISLPAADVAFVDRYAADTGAPSRSMVMHRAIELLRQAELEEAYAEAAQQWTDEADDWESTSADGIDGAGGADDAPR